jgi:CRISPR-associated exonuclease Cas4
MATSVGSGDPNSEDEEDSWIMISALQHFIYCPRQCALIHIEQVFSENVFTMRGHANHERVDDSTVNTGGGKRVVRALPLYSRLYGLSGRADVVEFFDTGQVIPVEYKSGNQAGKLHDRVQLAAQAFCLEEMFCKKIETGAIYWIGSKQRETIVLDAELRATTKEIIDQTTNLLRQERMPPAVYDRRCDNCSLYELCQPEILTQIKSKKQARIDLYQDD